MNKNCIKSAAGAENLPLNLSWKQGFTSLHLGLTLRRIFKCISGDGLTDPTLFFCYLGTAAYPWKCLETQQLRLSLWNPFFPRIKILKSARQILFVNLVRKDMKGVTVNFLNRLSMSIARLHFFQTTTYGCSMIFTTVGHRSEAAWRIALGAAESGTFHGGRGTVGLRISRGSKLALHTWWRNPPLGIFGIYIQVALYTYVYIYI